MLVGGGQRYVKWFQPKVMVLDFKEKVDSLQNYFSQSNSLTQVIKFYFVGNRDRKFWGGAIGYVIVRWRFLIGWAGSNQVEGDDSQCMVLKQTNLGTNQKRFWIYTSNVLRETKWFEPENWPIKSKENFVKIKTWNLRTSRCRDSWKRCKSGKS